MTSVLNRASGTNPTCPELASTPVLASGVCAGSRPDATGQVGWESGIDNSSRASGIFVIISIIQRFPNPPQTDPPQAFTLPSFLTTSVLCHFSKRVDGFWGHGRRLYMMLNPCSWHVLTGCVLDGVCIGCVRTKPATRDKFTRVILVCFLGPTV